MPHSPLRLRGVVGNGELSILHTESADLQTKVDSAVWPTGRDGEWAAETELLSVLVPESNAHGESSFFVERMQGRPSLFTREERV
jgi:hypothetical protein